MVTSPLPEVNTMVQSLSVAPSDQLEISEHNVHADLKLHSDVTPPGMHKLPSAAPSVLYFITSSTNDVAFACCKRHKKHTMQRAAKFITKQMLDYTLSITITNTTSVVTLVNNKLVDVMEYHMFYYLLYYFILFLILHCKQILSYFFKTVFAVFS